MPDREKVIKEYEDYVNSYISLTTSHDYEYEMHKAVLALLKEQQEAVVRCKDCKHLDPEDHHCDSGHDIVWQLSRRDNWFCADGERKGW